MGFCFYPTPRMQIQPLNSLKTVSKVGDLSLTIATTAHCFGALSQVSGLFLSCDHTMIDAHSFTVSARYVCVNSISELLSTLWFSRCIYRIKWGRILSIVSSTRTSASVLQFATSSDHIPKLMAKHYVIFLHNTPRAKLPNDHYLTTNIFVHCRRKCYCLVNERLMHA